MPEIFGVRVDSVDLQQAMKFVATHLKSGQKTFVTTPNPEMVMLAQKDEAFRQILNRADLAIPDGWGLKLAAPGLPRTTGRELMLALIRKGYKTLLVGGKPGIAEKAAERLRSLLVGTPTRCDLFSMTEPDIAVINRLCPDLLFLALGHGRQEKWIAKNLPQLKVKLAMGVGGALDQLVDRSLVAPVWLQKAGLEWLYRLLRQPRRIKRQLALLKFLVKIYL